MLRLTLSRRSNGKGRKEGRNDGLESPRGRRGRQSVRKPHIDRQCRARKRQLKVWQDSLPRVSPQSGVSDDRQGCSNRVEKKTILGCIKWDLNKYLNFWCIIIYSFNYQTYNHKDNIKEILEIIFIYKNLLYKCYSYGKKGASISWV